MAPAGRSRTGRFPDELFLRVAVAHLFKLHGIDQDVFLDAELLLQHQCDLLVTPVSSEGFNDTIEKGSNRDDQSRNRKGKSQGGGQIKQVVQGKKTKPGRGCNGEPGQKPQHDFCHADGTVRALNNLSEIQCLCRTGLYDAHCVISSNVG